MHLHLHHTSNLHQLFFTTSKTFPPNTIRSENYRIVGLSRARLVLILLTLPQIMTRNPPGSFASSSATTANRTLPSGGITIHTTNPTQTPSRGTNTNCINTTGDGNVNCNNTTGDGNKNCTNCTNCFNCTNCSDCKDCNDCMNSNDCRVCEECKNCTDCTQCIRCMNCSNLKGVTDGKNQRG